MLLQAKATHQQTRAHNSGLVLRCLYDLGPISRADVARITWLTRTTVSEVVSEFLADGLVREVGRGPSSGGKAPILLEVVDDSRHVVALDLGERVFSGALVNLRGVVRRVVELPVDGRNGDDALLVLYRLIDDLAAGAGSTILGIGGVGTPGLVGLRDRHDPLGRQSRRQDLPLGSMLHDRYEQPISIANDSHAAALGEYLFTRKGRVDNLIAIKVGDGIGAGIVLGGQLFQGDGHGAGEIGHVAAVNDGRQCRCGRFGCLETVAGSRAIVLDATAAAELAPQSLLGRRLAQAGTLTLDDVKVALDAGDEPARQLVVAAGRALGSSIAALIGALNVNRILLLGSVPELGDVWLEAVRDEASRLVLGMLVDGTRIDLGRSADDVVLLGVSALLITRELDLVPRR